jgi:hypothetical protein
MKRRASLTAFAFVALVASGCTASDRDYVRNHIVLLQPETSSASLAAARAPEVLASLNPAPKKP